ncbi:hypothetical protein ABE099_09190 [Paenibacillus turicensis]|uniref:hypothetical protein n=1 Tax=Paenibacillus turicensis TaxID=160487 RepID=UPI003D2A5063
MNKNVSWLLKITAVVILLALGTFVATRFLPQSAISTEQPIEQQQAVDHEDDITLTIDGNNFIPDVTRSIHFEYMKDLTLRDALRSSNLIILNENGSAIQSVGNVALDTSLAWGVKLNQKELKANHWGTKLKMGDHISVYVTSTRLYPENTMEGSLVLSVQGGIHKPELRRYFLTKFKEGITVRDLLVSSGIVQLTPNYKQILAVNGYHCDATEQWVLKVNKKVLIEAGLDMRLSANDIVDIELVRY